MIIRKATKKDLKEIAEIFRIESTKPPYNKKRTLQGTLRQIKEDFENSSIYVAIEDNKIIGFIIVRRDSDKNKIWINELWILKEYQGRGLGKMFMNKIEFKYSKKGIRIFELVANTQKGGAEGFYKKLGYKIDKSMVFMKKIK